MKKLIVITSGKGGVGKTTTAINFGAALNYFGRDVLVIGEHFLREAVDHQNFRRQVVFPNYFGKKIGREIDVSRIE